MNYGSSEEFLTVAIHQATGMIAAQADCDIDEAFHRLNIRAAAMGQTEVVRFLLTHNPDPTIREPIWRATALEAAQFHKRDEVVALLQAAAGSQ